MEREIKKFSRWRKTKRGWRRLSKTASEQFSEWQNKHPENHVLASVNYGIGQEEELVVWFHRVK